jgi:hypothetical protein
VKIIGKQNDFFIKQLFDFKKIPIYNNKILWQCQGIFRNFFLDIVKNYEDILHKLEIKGLWYKV